nr:MAG TPA: hypothetical protein [Caudoviricetes sp.]DAP25120.1 MAG TPA: hypothetical protein [Caudoviricetes sp.]
MIRAICLLLLHYNFLFTQLSLLSVKERQSNKTKFLF